MGNLIRTMRQSGHYIISKQLILPVVSVFSPLVFLLFIVELCHITHGLMSPEDVNRSNFDKNTFWNFKRNRIGNAVGDDQIQMSSEQDIKIFMPEQDLKLAILNP